jgi:hypothetical protein
VKGRADRGGASGQAAAGDDDEECKGEGDAGDGGGGQRRCAHLDLHRDTGTQTQWRRRGDTERESAQGH